MQSGGTEDARGLFDLLTLIIIDGHSKNDNLATAGLQAGANGSCHGASHWSDGLVAWEWWHGHYITLW